MRTERLAGYVNALSDDRARAALERCCGARQWVDAVLAARPFASDVELLAAAEPTRAALARENRAYEQRFGHVFLVSATGKTADEMLAALRARLANDPAAELRVAAEEQAKITRLRLEKLVAA